MLALLVATAVAYTRPIHATLGNVQEQTLEMRCDLTERPDSTSRMVVQSRTFQDTIWGSYRLSNGDSGEALQKRGPHADGVYAMLEITINAVDDYFLDVVFWDHTDTVAARIQVPDLRNFCD